MTTATRSRRTRIIEVDGNGRPKRRWKQWLTRTFKITVAVASLIAFWKAWGWRVLAAVIAFAGTAGAAVLEV